MNFTRDGLRYELEMFSKKLTTENYENALKIYDFLKNKRGYTGEFQIYTYELFDRAFTFPRVRRYNDVMDNLTMLEHFEDNLNLNPTNKKHLANFLRVARTVRDNLNDKYKDSFKDPGEEEIDKAPVD